MRTSLRAAIAALTLTAATALPAAAQTSTTSTFKIAYVNPAAILQSAPGREAAEATLQRELQGAQVQIKRMSDSLGTAVDEYRKVQATLTAAQRETREKTLQTRQADYQRRQQALEEQFEQRRAALMNPIMEQVRKALEDIRAEEGFAFILSNEPGNSLIIAADKNLDITERVVARLRTLGAPVAGAATPPRPQGPATSPSGVTRPRP